LEPNTIVVYLVKGEYNPESEHSIVWDTIPEIKTIVKNHTQNLIISKKDENGK
jgi:dTDP-4-dehydrorhamnose 3,5-epimerase-like enzyme